MSLSRYEFDILNYLLQSETCNNLLRELSNELCISASTISNNLSLLKEKGYIKLDNEQLTITESGVSEMESFRVKKAVIFAAGMGSRLRPATSNMPKPMVTVKGVRIIDTLIDAFLSVGISDITIVGGYKFDKLRELLVKYPFLTIIENPEYETTNNISSAVLSADHLTGGCYICEADLYISNPKIISKYQYESNILGSFSIETDDWCFRMDDGYLTDYQKGNTYCYNYYGISYWDPEDCEKLKKDFVTVYNEQGGKDLFWEFIPFVVKSNEYNVRIRVCQKQDIVEIDNYYELCQLDSSYQERMGGFKDES